MRPYLGRLDPPESHRDVYPRRRQPPPSNHGQPVTSFDNRYVEPVGPVFHPYKLQQSEYHGAIQPRSYYEVNGVWIVSGAILVNVKSGPMPREAHVEIEAITNTGQVIFMLNVLLNGPTAIGFAYFLSSSGRRMISFMQGVPNMELGVFPLDTELVSIRVKNNDIEEETADQTIMETDIDILSYVPL